ncbi:Putative transcription factor [Komagataella phaffii]|nr:GQ67_01359T0 [Komagataella phaffii]AOA66203.1 GQ68_01375T0 [Komagataella phaffii GS115]
MTPKPSLVPPLDDSDKGATGSIGSSTRKHKIDKGRSTDTSLPVDGQTSSIPNRSRTKRACSRCKRRKIKCDGGSPCSNCSKHTQPCDYNLWLPRDSVDNRGFRSGLVSLEQKKPSREEYIKYLENRIMELQSSTHTCAGVNHLEKANCDQMFLKNHYQYSQNRYGVVTRYHSILANKFAESVHAILTAQESEDLAVPRVQYYGWNMSVGHYLKQRTLPPFDPLIDTVRDFCLCSWLIDFFLDRINPLFSFIHPKVFRNQYDNYMLIVSKEVPSESTRLFTSILYLIFAISIRFSEAHPEIPIDIKAKINPRLEEKLFDSAHEVISKLSFEWQSVELIQSWVLVTLYLRATHRQNSSFGSLGTAIRMCKGMSLNLNIVVEAPLKQYEVIKAKRIFWLV